MRPGSLSGRKCIQLVREMLQTHAIQATVSRRRSAEQRYFKHRKDRGICLRGKYRP